MWLAGCPCGYWEWVESMGKVSRKWVSSGSGCKEVYRFPHNILLIPTPLVSAHFCSSIPTYCSFFKCFSFLFQHIFVIYV